MYLSHFGLTEPPFRITPHTEFFFSGANRGATLEALLYAITHDEGIVKVTGEVGSGKTMLCRVLVERLPKNVETIYLANPSLSRDEILHVLAADLQVESRGERVTILLRALQEKLIKLYAAGRRVVVLIDEAHAMPMETLEEVRLLSNLESNRAKLLQIVLFGQPELDDHLGVPNMRQLRERITHSFKLEPLVRSDIDSYIDFRMRAAGYKGPNVFAPQALRAIAQESEGLTRRINILADKSLLAAFADNSHQVTAKHAAAAVRDSGFKRSGVRVGGRAGLLAAGAAAGLALGVGWHLFQAGSAPVAPPAPTRAAAQHGAGPGPESGASAKPQAAPAQQPPAAAPQVATAAAAPATAPVGAAPPAMAPTPPSLPASAPSGSVPAAAAQTADPAPPMPPAGAAPAPSPPPAAAATLARATAVPAAGAVAMRQPPPPAGGRLALDRFAATQAWLGAAPGDHYSIQLATMSEAETEDLERLLRQAAELLNPDELYVYGVKINGRQHYRAAYGDFPSADAAAKAIDDLPATLRSRRPYQRSVDAMRAQNLQ
jgi:type II secretory pathway predicted ATPase ExeA/septal ring-binding cell division protein DamX